MEFGLMQQAQIEAPFSEHPSGFPQSTWLLPTFTIQNLHHSFVKNLKLLQPIPENLNSRLICISGFT